MNDLPASFKVVRTDRELEMPRVDARLRSAGGRLMVLPDGTPEDELAREVADADLLLMCYARIGRRVIAGAPKLKAIIKYGVGIDAIDIDAAREFGVPVVNVPAYAEETVAEGAFALLMALFKRFKPIHQAMQTEGWAWPECRWLAGDLAGKTLGLVGLGRIGRSMARMAGAFRMRVLAYDPHLALQALPPGVQSCGSLDTLLSASDAVSIHCVLNAQTRHLIGSAQLARMKPSAFLVNVSRGEIVDEAALLQALIERRIAGAALDVYGQEPLSRQGHRLSALYEMDNVILWPHLSFYTVEAMQRLEDETLERCFEALRGQPLQVASRDPRLRAQTRGVRFVEPG
ncbi:MAG: C-terminal binding protein [Burkholderiaceae bacterium]|nr:C-terminal binding protein [Burkholderiaceae bacterium]